MKKKKAPYSGIINIQEEYKEYSRFCGGKSKKFTVYTEWEAHIKELLTGFETPQELYNFKHYCINADRAQAKAPEMYTAYVALLIPLYLDIFWEGMPAYLAIILLFGAAFLAMILNKKLAKDSHFFEDVISIIESVEKEKE